MGIIGWIVFGFVVGLLARAVMPGRDSMGIVATTVLGIIGAVVAGYIGTAFGWYTTNSGAGLIAAALGAVLVLAIYNAVIRSKGSRRLDQSHRDRFAA